MIFIFLFVQGPALKPARLALDRTSCKFTDIIISYVIITLLSVFDALYALL